MCDHDRAAVLLDKALAEAERHGWQEIRALALSVRGHLGIGYGDLAAAREAFASSLELFRTLDDPAGLADCLSGFGAACRWRHELEDSARYYAEACALQERSGDQYELGIILRGMANVKNSAGDPDEAKRLLLRARACFEESGNRFQVANCLNDLGEIARKTGQLTDAEALYRRAAVLYESLGSAEATTPRFNLGMVLLAQEEYAKARVVFDGELAKFAADERLLDKLWLHAGLLPCAAHARDWAAWDHDLRRVLALLEDLVDEDIPWCAELAGRLCAEAGDHERSRRAYELARSQFERMKHDDEIARVDEALARLS
jgi:tetratricopeptide (TPR) repeat protein